MDRSSLSNLQDAANEVKGCQSSQEKFEALAKAFELFSQETARLEQAYASLKKQFASVNQELELTNQKLTKKIAELDHTKVYLENILTNMSQGLLFIDLKGVIRTVNKPAEGILNLKIDQSVGEHYNRFFSDDEFGFSLHDALTEKEAPKMLYVTHSDEFGDREFEIETGFIHQDESPPSAQHIPGLIILIRDITDMRQLQVVANRNDRMKVLGEMAAMVAHEIRNPLGGIKGFASLLSRDLNEQPNLQGMANQIIEGTDSLNKLVTNVLNYSRPLEIELKEENLVKLTKEAIDHTKMDGALKRDDLIWNTELPNTPVPTLVDAQLYKSALLNLIVNAIQAMPNGGTISVSLQVEKQKAMITVKDSGTGIQKENLEKIFRPFFTTKPRGHGFGLAEVHRVIQEHNGTIDVKSTSNVGTSFTIEIPLVKPKEKLIKNKNGTSHVD